MGGRLWQVVPAIDTNQPTEPASMKTVLLAGFEPFGGEALNPSALAMSALAGRQIAGRRVATLVLPCIFGKSLTLLRREIQRLRPELVICTGQAGGRACLSVERVAINIADASLPDNAGNRPVDQPVVRGGSAAYFSTLPIKTIVASWQSAGLPGAVSHSAGTFVCNHIFYGLMRTLARNPNVRGGFIHVPYLPDQARRMAKGTPSLPLNQIVRGLEIAIASSLPPAKTGT